MSHTGKTGGDLERVVSNGDFRTALKAILAHEESGGADTQYPWTPDDISADQAVVEKLTQTDVVNGPVGAYYHLANPQAVREAIEEEENPSEKPLSEMIDEMDTQNIPSNIFAPIVGYDDIKKRFARALESQSVRQSIILVGPRGSAKSVFMQEILRLPRVEYLKGKDATVAGVEEKLLKNPNYVVVDEFDKLPADVFDVFLNWQDPRLPFSVSKSQRSGEIDDTGPVFATGNDTDRVPDPNLDRFWDFYFESYSEDEFMEVLSNLLPRDFDISPELAEYIGQRLRRYDRRASVRDAERIAEVADTEADVDEEVDLLEEYGQ